MAEGRSKGSAVEGEKIGLVTRQWDLMLPTKAGGVRRFNFKLRIRSTATISEAYASPDDKVEFSTSLVQIGDSIGANVISGWTRKPPGPPNVTAVSGTHSGTTVGIVGGCYACIDAPAKEHLEDPTFNDRHPAVVQKKIVRSDKDPLSREHSTT